MRTVTASVRVKSWTDPVTEQSGHDPRSLYVETFWLPTLGPTASWLLRRLENRLEASPDGFVMDYASMSRELGLGGNTGKNSAFMKSIDRLDHFGLARATGAVLYVRRRMPSLTPRQLQRLPPDAHRLHDNWAETAEVGPR